MTDAEKDLAELRSEQNVLLAYCAEMFSKGGTTKPKPTDPTLGIIADFFELRCNERDVMRSRLAAALEQAGQ
jgi:hypothetical protein